MSGKAQKEGEEEPPPSTNPIIRAFVAVTDILNLTAVQFFLYLCFVFVFQMVAEALRIPTEYYFDKFIADTFIDNHFDSSHNTFLSIRRTADIWEWGNNVLWPGLLGDLGPCQSDVGFGAKACQDDVWPDGEGSFHLNGATPFTIDELVERMDSFDWTDGIVIKQARVGPTDCGTTEQLGECLPDVYHGDGGFATSSATFGYNWTHPDLPPAHPWTHFTAEQLGSAPQLQSASIPSMRSYETAGFVALVIPFFSDTYLAEQTGTPSEVTDYRDHHVSTTNGRKARYYCVRLSPNGLHVRQVCDPMTNGRSTGVVRKAIEDMWNDLKRGHFLDSRTRLLSITLQLRSNPRGVRYKNTLMFELSSLGAVFTSYDVETRVLDSSNIFQMGLFSNIALAMVIFFTLLEGIELGSSGLGPYFSDMWNVMDWANFLLYFVVYVQIGAVDSAVKETPRHTPCTSYLCKDVGYFDDWKVMAEFRLAKMLLSLCVCVQLLKVLKFASQLVPKMGLATTVLKKALPDLVFFGICFMVSVFAFSAMLTVQLGPVMQDYIDQIPAFISLFRALFGDFDIDLILDNSRGYLNAILFLAYLFVAIFILLSMFLAILAEAQVDVREQQKAQDDEDKENGVVKDWDEYGVISAGYRTAVRAVKSLRTGANAVTPTPTPADAGPGAEAAVPEAHESRSAKEPTSQDLLDAVERLRRELHELKAGATSGGSSVRPSPISISPAHLTGAPTVASSDRPRLPSNTPNALSQAFYSSNVGAMLGVSRAADPMAC